MLTLTPAETALVELGHLLRAAAYQFVTVTPESHRRVNARAENATARTVRDALGWSRPFAPDLLPPAMRACLDRADMLVADGSLLRSKVRFSTLGTQLFVHSAYPTTDEHAVFFGPDTYRFCRYLARVAPAATCVVDVGCGSGAGGLSLADRVDRIVLTDINRRALSFATINAHLAGLQDRVEVCHGDLYAGVRGAFDLVVANPPYLVDPSHRIYRDGGGALGIDLGLRMVREGLARVAPGGSVMLYTGAPIVDGEDVVRTALTNLAGSLSYEELDPDVFGEELETPTYAGVERLAAIGACVRK